MTTITKFRKNALEEVRVDWVDFKGRELLNIRVWLEASPGEFVPTKKGLALSLEKFQELFEALEKAKRVITKVI